MTRVRPGARHPFGSSGRYVLFEEIGCRANNLGHLLRLRIYFAFLCLVGHAQRLRYCEGMKKIWFSQVHYFDKVHQLSMVSLRIVSQMNPGEMKEKLAKLGRAGLLAYGLFNSITYTAMFYVAFLAFEKSTGQNPANNLKACLGVSTFSLL